MNTEIKSVPHQEQRYETCSTIEFNTWMKELFDPHSESPKLALAGPKFYWMITGKFNPRNMRPGPGNAHDRRKNRRLYARMWKIFSPMQSALTGIEIDNL